MASDAIAVEQFVALQWQGVAAQQAVSGVQRFSSSAWLSDVSDCLVASLSAYVLKDQGGEPVSATETISRKVRPRWIPQWLWRRVPEQSKSVTLTVTPEWTCPQATVKVPELKPAVQFVARDFDRGEWVETR